MGEKVGLINLTYGLHEMGLAHASDAAHGNCHIGLDRLAVDVAAYRELFVVFRRDGHADGGVLVLLIAQGCSAEIGGRLYIWR